MGQPTHAQLHSQYAIYVLLSNIFFNYKLQNFMANLYNFPFLPKYCKYGRLADVTWGNLGNINFFFFLILTIFKILIFF